ncbi:YigZ family protein [Lysobacter sp. TY2-98]|uniref:IMPACT family protein n=1 Tax=Lysobacter sp. TY2-98 TaxID=2290922 RepID=UPI000E209AD2|nr:YigZ family protein [Lysobacter sp. TY2-98]AXK72288.1 YigZ family protein [Lysobacter sp. TY2-98]
MLTLAGPASAALEVKHSRFVAQAAPVTSPDAALAFLAQVRDAAATHNCWAYRIGQGYRSSDDGEPAGTAGRPILAAIDGQRVDGVVVVVARWYGGIKLGAGGLVRAYGGCAAECLRLADKIERVETAVVRLRFGFGDTGAVHATLATVEVERLDERFDGDGVELAIRLRADRVGTLKAHLRDATRDRVRLLESPSDA